MKTPARIALSAGIAAVLLGLLVLWSGLEPSEALAAVERLSLGTFLAALAVHVGIYAARAARFRVLLPPRSRPPFLSCFVIGAAHNFAAYVLPAKTGEASWVVYLRAQCGVPAALGLASLVVSRLLDGAVLCAALAAACLALSLGGAYPELDWLAPLGWTLAAVFVALFALGARGDVLARLVAGGGELAGLGRHRLGARVLARVREVADALRRASGEGRLVASLAITLPIWLGVFGFYAILARGMGLGSDLGFAEATFGASLAVAFNMLPVNGVAGFGTQEAGWAIGFGALGVERELALATGLGVHLVQLFDVALLGAIAHLAMGAIRPTAMAAPAERGERAPSDLDRL